MQDREAQIKSTSQVLEESLNEVFSAEHFQRFLAFISGNSNYSYRNVILILQQCPQATKKMGFKAWMKVGRMVKGGERGLRINACFDKDERETQPQKAPSQKKRRQGEQSGDYSSFRRISVFDISQTACMVGDDEYIGQTTQPAVLPTANVFEAVQPVGGVGGYDELLADLRVLSPLPIILRSGARIDGGSSYSSIVINNDMSQLHTIRTIINRIARVWLCSSCADNEHLEIVSDSVAFTVCKSLRLDTSDYSFRQIAKYSLGRERAMPERFLDDIQKTALYFIDTLDGLRLARATGYHSDEFFLFSSKKTAMRLFRQGYFTYLVYPGDGELLAMSQKEIAQYDEPFAVPSSDWFRMEPVIEWAARTFL